MYSHAAIHYLFQLESKLLDRKLARQAELGIRPSVFGVRLPRRGTQPLTHTIEVARLAEPCHEELRRAA